MEAQLSEEIDRTESPSIGGSFEAVPSMRLGPVAPTRDPQSNVRHPTSPWLVNGWFDALFVVNVGWPLLAAALVFLGPQLQSGVSFWQVYFISTPHRWITLPLVFLDRRRFSERPWAFILIGVALTAACLGTRLVTGSLTCILSIDYLWNAWHFASQHSGIVRTYSRLSGQTSPGSGTVEKVLMRAFVVYVMLRISDLAWPLFGQPLHALGFFQDTLRTGYHQALACTDWIALALPVALLIKLRPSLRSQGRPAALYLGSVLALYVGLLACAHRHLFEIIPALVVVMALFHASEYLALVTWRVHREHPIDPEAIERLARDDSTQPFDSNHIGEPDETSAAPVNLLKSVVPSWGTSLLLFCVALGIAGWVSDRRAVEFWLTLNLIVSFLHYAYDGMIWKRGRRSTPAPSPQFSLHN